MHIQVWKDVFVVFAGIGGVTAISFVLVDYVRLRRAEYIEMKAAKAVAILREDGGTTSACANDHCSAFRSAVCADGRCRAHCRLYCHCKGNQ